MSISWQPHPLSENQKVQTAGEQIQKNLFEHERAVTLS